MMETGARSSSIVATAACAASLLFLGSVASVAQAPSAKGADARTAILAQHKQIDGAYARAAMSPFTAVSVQYFEAGQTHRLGFGATGVTFDPEGAMTDVIELTFIDDVFWITPVSGPHTPAMLKTHGDDDSVTTPGTPISGKTKLLPRDVVGVGRHVVQFVTQQGLGNARVFDPESPARKAFAGLKWFEPNLALQVKAVFVPNPTPGKVIIGTSRGLSKEFYRVGVFEFQIEGKPQKLTALTGSKAPRVGDEFFVPFRDATTGVESYSVGRYLNIPYVEGTSQYVLDFNGATNPLCNYSPHYNCPIPPRENVVSVAIRAGEMTYPRPH
jgi:uncharacterized protein (DUF1684 family)